MFLPCMEIHSGVAVWKEQTQQRFLYLLECEQRRGRIWSDVEAAWNLGTEGLSQGKSFSHSVHLFSLWEKKIIALHMDFYGKQTKNKTTTTLLKAEKCCISTKQRMGQCTYLMLKQTPISCTLRTNRKGFHVDKLG